MEAPVDKPLSDELSERLERLERECHRLRRDLHRWRRAGVTVLLIGVLLLAIGGAQNPDPPPPPPGGLQKAGRPSHPIDLFPTVAAKAFLLVGPDVTLKDPKPRAMLAVEDGSTVLTFLGPGKEPLLSLRAGQ